MEQKTEHKKPEVKFSAGPVSAAVWLNSGQTKDGKLAEYRTISLQRVYKDKKDQWQNTGSLRLNDLPKAALVLSKAFEYLTLKDNSSSSEAVY